MSGKVYNGEKAIISLTSWKARINTVAKTLYSLYTQCPGFHIVLVLSEEEFPKKEAELPETLMLFVENELIELLWVYKNYKVSKKLIPCCTYTNVPIIITDDDVIIVTNFAEELYQNWLKHKTWFISYIKSSAKPPYIGCACSLIPPNANEYIKTQFDENKITSTYEDEFLRFLPSKLKTGLLGLHYHFPFYFHDEIRPINGSAKVRSWKNKQRFC